MTRIMLAFVALAIVAGCKKPKPPVGGTTTSTARSDDAPVTPSPGPKIVNQSGNLTVKGGEGGFQAPRLAAGREANHAELKDLHLAIFQATQLDPNENPPGMDEVMAAVRQNHKLAAHVKEEIVIITGSTQKDGVFAYTQWPQRAGKHYVVTKLGVEDMTPAELKAKLEAQKSPVKLSQ